MKTIDGIPTYDSLYDFGEELKSRNGLSDIAKNTPWCDDGIFLGTDQYKLEEYGGLKAENSYMIFRNANDPDCAFIVRYNCPDGTLTFKLHSVMPL